MRTYSSEDAFVSAMMNEFQLRGLPHHKMHGNIYQSGFPDLFIAAKDHFVVCEAKVLPQLKPNLEQLWHALRPQQRKNLCQYAPMNCPCFVAADTHLGVVLVPHIHFPKVLQWPKPLPLDPWVHADVRELVDAMLV